MEVKHRVDPTNVHVGYVDTEKPKPESESAEDVRCPCCTLLMQFTTQAWQCRNPYCDINQSPVKQFATGAVRSKDADNVRFDLITPVGIRRVAETYAEGAAKYGDNNWQKGIPAGECINHALKHINQWLSGDTSEDHLAHAAWNLFAVMHYEEKLPSMLKDLAYRRVQDESKDDAPIPVVEPQRCKSTAF